MQMVTAAVACSGRQPHHADCYTGMRSARCQIAECNACDCRLGVVADVGQTLNSSTTYQHLVANNPDVSSMPRSLDLLLASFLSAFCLTAVCFDCTCIMSLIRGGFSGCSALDDAK